MQQIQGSSMVMQTRRDDTEKTLAQLLSKSQSELVEMKEKFDALQKESEEKDQRISTLNTLVESNKQELESCREKIEKGQKALEDEVKLVTET